MLVQSQVFKKPIVIGENEPIHKAVRLIFNHGISLLPVVRKKKLVGVLTERDVLAKLLPSMKEFIESTSASEAFENIEKKLPDFLMQPVQLLMHSNPYTVTQKTPLLKAQSLMLLHKIHRLPVVNRKNEVVGVISQADIFKALAGQTVMSENDQFHEWYAKFYEMIEPTSAKEAPEMKPLDKLFTKHNVYRVVDIFCGSGGHAIALGQRSYEVLGLNKYKHFHEEAIKKLEQSFSKDYRGTRPTFLWGNYLSLLQKRTSDYDAAMLMGNALSHHVSSYKEILKAISSSLVKKDAVLVLQLTNYDKVLEHMNGTQYFKIVKDPHQKGIRWAFMEMFNKPNLTKKTILYTISVLRNEGEAWIQDSVNSAPLAYFTEKSICELLKKNGFNNLRVYGSRYYEDPFKQTFDKDIHDWINIVAMR